MVWAAGKDIGPRKILFRVDKIEITGNKKVEKEAVLQKMSSREGMVVDNYLIRNDIEKIYSLKYFESVEVQQLEKTGKNILRVVVVEKPIVNTITIEGNDELNTDELKEQIKTKQYSILDINTVKNDVKDLQKFYEEKGFYLAAITYQLKPLNKENVELIFNIKEFEKVKVKKVIYLGNRAFSDTELKEIMETREESLMGWMSGAGSFKEFNFQTDVERIKYFYKTKGYLQVYVGSPEITITEDRKWVFISIAINEGPQFTVNNIEFDGEILFPEEKLREKIVLKTDNIYSEEDLRKDIQALTEMYQDEGYAFANVLRTLNIVPGENKVDIQFSFEKGKMAYIGKIDVKGNNKTRDKVVRRELLIREGMKYSGSAMRRSKENVNRLGFFEPNSVVFNTTTPKGKDNVLDVEINIKERNTGQITLGAGYSTSTKGFINASISQNNFRGLGQTLSFSLNLADQTQTYNVGFTEPYLFDSKWTAGGDIFSTRDSTSASYAIDKKGFDARIGYPVFDFTKLFLTYKFVDTELTRVTDPRLDPEIENGVASSVEGSLIFDQRDNRFEPTKGVFTSLSLEYTGLGGVKRWIRSEADARYYKNFYSDFVFRSRINAARLFESDDDRKIPRSEKFFLGGPRNLRGFENEAIGPKTEATLENGQKLKFNERGLLMVLGQLEIEHPLVKEAGLKWVVFMDGGNVYKNKFGEDGSTDLKYDYGFGFRWFSPIGILRFEFGYPINPGPEDASSQFHFDIGQLF